MIFFVFILAIIIFYEMKIFSNNEFNKDYISPAQTTAVNGVFVVLVLLSHAAQYMNLDGVYDTPYVTMKSNLGQMVVATFLFYSGYGIMESIKRKGTPYVKDIPFKRFFKVFYHMAIVVGLYVIMNAFLGRKFVLKNTLLALTGWVSIGNSNWYILAVFVVYIFTFIAFMIFRKKHIPAVALVSLLSVGYVYLLMVVGKESWYYNTIILYSVGMWYSLFKEHIEKLLFRNDTIFIAVSGMAVAVYYYIYLNRGKGIEWYSVWGIMFMVLVLLATMKLSVNNKILTWFGSHVFSIYTLQRIPMAILTELGLNSTHKYAFVVLCFFITMALAVVFDAAIAKLDAFIYKPRSKVLKDSKN